MDLMFRLFTSKTMQGIAIAALATALKDYGITPGQLDGFLSWGTEGVQWAALAYAATGRFLASKSLRSTARLT